jgi:hypothetical protein
MTNELPKVIADYIAAANSSDVEDVVACFSDTAIVHDEGRERRGRDAIRAWTQETDRKYHPKTEVLDVVTVAADTVLVTGRVSGTFPGSPLDLRYAFTLEGDRIARLQIG